MYALKYISNVLKRETERTQRGLLVERYALGYREWKHMKDTILKIVSTIRAKHGPKIAALGTAVFGGSISWSARPLLKVRGLS